MSPARHPMNPMTPLLPLPAPEEACGRLTVRAGPVGDAGVMLKSPTERPLEYRYPTQGLEEWLYTWFSNWTATSQIQEICNWQGRTEPEPNLPVSSEATSSSQTGKLHWISVSPETTRRANGIALWERWSGNFGIRAAYKPGWRGVRYGPIAAVCPYSAGACGRIPYFPPTMRSPEPPSPITHQTRHNMVTARSREVRVSLNDRIDALNKITPKGSPAKRVFETVGDIFPLLLDKKIYSADSLQLSEYCVVVCETLETAIQGKNTGDLDESERMAVEDSERAMREIERTLKRASSTPPTRYNKEKIKNHLVEVQRLLNALDALRLLPHENTSGGEPDLTLYGPHGATIRLAPKEACGRLITHTFLPCELPSLIEVILSGKDRDQAIRRLPVDEAQTLIDVMHEAVKRPNIPLPTRQRCLKLLYRTCGYRALVPKTFKVLVYYDGTSDPLFRGGFADVWKGEFFGWAVAVKVIRTDSKSGLKKFIERFCKEAVLWKFLRHPNVLPLIGVSILETRFAMVSKWMINGCIDEYVKAHLDADRLGLLAGAAEGLIYLHDIGLVHGDLKASNILVDEAGQARLADFGLLKIISDPANNLSSSSNSQGGTVRWMSPELIYPGQFGLEKSSPTKPSDCYAFGMVIYEIISGNIPFHEHATPAVSVMVTKGELPSRGAKFTDSLWAVLEWCWATQPSARPSVEVVLQSLKAVPSPPELPPWSGGEVERGGDESNLDQSRDGYTIHSQLLERYANQNSRSQTPLAL